ncbi:nitrate- and nitrite sensing domain-containing protein [Euzebya tangerina]|uniref:sensor histidine kinase n=1 Tax=Euzebya tangerina TaxID=591198 RepID=UPI000E30BFFE|nr:nitrate- and nitrite sensing domain-containing protein [Euzebya tangerina]
MLRNASVRTRLIVGAAIPTLLLLLAAGWQAFGAFQDFRATNNVEIVADIAVDGRGLLSALQVERTQSIQYVLGSRGDDAERTARLEEQLAAAHATTDVAAAQVLSLGDQPDIELLSDQTRESLRAAEAAVVTIAELREQILSGQGASLAVYNNYGSLIGSLLDADRDLLNEVDNARIEAELRALQTVSNVKDATLALSAVRLLDADAGVNPRNREQIEASEISERQTWLEIAQGILTPTELDELEQAATPETACFDVPGASGCEDGASEVDSMVEGSTDVAGSLQALELRYAADAVAAADAVRNGAVTTLGTTAVLGVVVLALLALLSAIIGGVVTPLRQLTSIADRVRTSLKEDVDRIADGETIEETAFDGEIAEELTSRADELGELARAMKSSTGEAVEIASRQAAIRGGVARTIEDVARREQTLVERQLSLLDVLEDAERDPDQLAQLFKLDHLATRMRRNAENLLLLSSGQLPGAHNAPPVSLVDVVRTAAAEIEQYNRVDVRVGVSATVAGYASTPLSHLLAELIENAAQFSPPESRVLVTGYTDRHGITIAVSDEGLGMTQGDLADARRRLASPPLLEVAESRRLGLYVVGLIANRLNLVVDLDVSDSGKGLTATVAIPATAFVDGVENAGQPAQDESARRDANLPSSLDSSGDALAALSQLLDASPAAPPELPAEVVPKEEVVLPTRARSEEPASDGDRGGISLSAASKGRKVDFDPSSIRDLMSGLNGIGEELSFGDDSPSDVPSAAPQAPAPAPAPQGAAAQPARAAAHSQAPGSEQPMPTRQPSVTGQGMNGQGTNGQSMPRPGMNGPDMNGLAAAAGAFGSITGQPQHPSAGAPPRQPTAPQQPAAGSAARPDGFPSAHRPSGGPADGLAAPGEPATQAASPAPMTTGFPGPSAARPQNGHPNHPDQPDSDLSDSKQLRPQRRRRSTTPSWSTPYAPQEQKQ